MEIKFTFMAGESFLQADVELTFRPVKQANLRQIMGCGSSETWLAAEIWQSTTSLKG
jgi:hypothetical protein